MAIFEEMNAAQAKASIVEAELILASIEAEEEAKRAAEEAARLAKEKQGYETGITYDQLARTPDDYEFEKVKFTGEVIQVMEGDGTTTIRFAVNGDYDKVLYCEYDSSIVSKRVLEDDTLTIYGVSYGLFSYEATSGATITIPAVLIENIDFKN